MTQPKEDDLAANRSGLRGADARRVAGEEEARRRMSREIHDDLCQRLAALGLELKVVRRKLPESDPRRGELDAVSAHLAELAEDLRRLSHDLHPGVLERSGLAEALRDHCAEIERRHGLPVRLSLRDAAGPFPPDVALGLYRIAQETLANAVRHAGARAVQVSLSAAKGTAHLAVTDDGAGFDPGAARRAGGLGLASLEERARLLGGRSRIDSALGAGTRIEVTVPLPAPEVHHLRRLLRRHRQGIAASALVILVLAGGLATTVLEARQARQEATRADEVAQFLEDLFQAANPRQVRGGRLPDARELLRRGTGRLATELKDQPLLRARLLDTLGGIHTDLGLFDEARPLLQEALAIRRRSGRPLEIAETLVRLGALAHLSGKGEAVPLFQQALAIREARLGPESPLVADVLNKLGAALAARGRFDEAEATLRRALALDERLWGERDPRLAKVLHNLSGIALHSGRTEKAERLLERALAIREATLREDDPDLAGSREALALLWQRQGRPAEAAQLLERLAATAEKVYGPEHPELARTLLNLGIARAETGEDATARQLFERALAIEERSLAPDHPQLVRTLAALADLDCEHGRYIVAEPLFRRLLKLKQEGATYDQWDKTLANWDRLLRATGREGRDNRDFRDTKGPENSSPRP
ncbi:MAG TPA: tetratricopeptide repeat protein [Thermoanaerobaculia bacterium]|jgi:tetratricopeptide (TPR) repeat protein|nr:tetratricopeptide repeat protein [Thermoanaerobaculia bacterium]